MPISTVCISSTYQQGQIPSRNRSPKTEQHIPGEQVARSSEFQARKIGQPKSAKVLIAAAPSNASQHRHSIPPSTSAVL